MIKLKKILIIAMIVFVVFSCNKKQEQNKTKKDDNININRLFSEKSFEKTTERDEDFKNLILQG